MSVKHKLCLICYVMVSLEASKEYYMYAVLSRRWIGHGYCHAAGSLLAFAVSPVAVQCNLSACFVFEMMKRVSIFPVPSV